MARLSFRLEASRLSMGPSEWRLLLVSAGLRANFAPPTGKESPGGLGRIAELLATTPTMSSRVDSASKTPSPSFTKSVSRQSMGHH